MCSRDPVELSTQFGSRMSQGETRGQLCILTPANFHLVLLLYSSQMKSLMGTSPGPGRTCTKPDTYTDRGRSFLITEPGAFPCDLLLSKKAAKRLLMGKYQTDG